MRSSKPLKTVEKWIKDHPEMIDEHWIENDEYAYPDHGRYSYWIYLNPGFINPLTEVHCVHEATASEALYHLKNIEPCTCEDCADNLYL